MLKIRRSTSGSIFNTKSTYVLKGLCLLGTIKDILLVAIKA